MHRRKKCKLLHRPEQIVADDLRRIQRPGMDHLEAHRADLREILERLASPLLTPSICESPPSSRDSPAGWPIRSTRPSANTNSADISRTRYLNENVGPLVDHPFSPKKVKILLKQHAGVPAVPVVKCGDRVRVVDLLAAPEQGKLGARVHASIDGEVKVATDAVFIEAQGV